MDISKLQINPMLLFMFDSITASFTSFKTFVPNVDSLTHILNNKARLILL